MELNNQLFMQQLKREMRERGLNSRGLLMQDYKNTLNLDQEKELHRAKIAAEKRTRELQDMFPQALGINQYEQDARWVKEMVDSVRKNEKLAMRFPV